jgi:hypothetical protein
VFFWIGLLVMLAVFASVFAWAVRGFDGRVHQPGTTHLKPPSAPGEGRSSPARPAGASTRGRPTR